MPRKGPAVRREVLPDPVYQNPLVTQLINKVLLHGKKTVAESTVYKALEIISDETARLSGLINRLLDWARMESGRRSYELRRERIELHRPLVGSIGPHEAEVPLCSLRSVHLVRHEVGKDVAAPRRGESGKPVRVLCFKAEAPSKRFSAAIQFRVIQDSLAE